MTTYLLVKWMHVHSSMLLVGTGFGSASYMFFGNHSGCVTAQAVIGRLVVRADWWFTTPSVIFRPLSGIWLAHAAGWPLLTPWLLLSMVQYLLADACWLPVVWFQVCMARMANDAAREGTALPPEFQRYRRWWEGLGYPAFVAMLAVFYLMVAKLTWS